MIIVLLLICIVLLVGFVLMGSHHIKERQTTQEKNHRDIYMEKVNID